MPNEKVLIVSVLILYGLSSFAYLALFISKNLKYANLGSWLIRIGFLLHTLVLILRTIEAGRLPFSNQYEFAISFAWGISITFIIFEHKYKFNTLGLFATPIILLVTFYAAMQSTEIQPLMPALQSRWLVVHVSTAIFSYGAFAVACAISLIFITREKFKDDEFTSAHLPQLEILDHIGYKAIALGFFMLTIVIVSGAIWAERAWGRYWRWDPKETWSLVTWIIYAIYLHVRLNKGWKNNKAAWYAIIGFAAVIFTYIGVNTVLVGLHSYG